MIKSIIPFLFAILDEYEKMLNPKWAWECDKAKNYKDIFYKLELVY